MNPAHTVYGSRYIGTVLTSSVRIKIISQSVIFLALSTRDSVGNCLIPNRPGMEYHADFGSLKDGLTPRLLRNRGNVS